MLGVGLGLAVGINLQDSHPMCMKRKIHALTATITELVTHIDTNQWAMYRQITNNDISAYELLRRMTVRLEGAMHKDIQLQK